MPVQPHEVHMKLNKHEPHLTGLLYMCLMLSLYIFLPGLGLHFSASRQCVHHTGATEAATKDLLQLVSMMSQLQITRESLDLDNELHDIMGRRM